MEESNRENPMGAVKEMAIELEIKAEEAAACPASQAYRLGMLEAARLASETAWAVIDQGGDAFAVAVKSFKEVMDSIDYLRSIDQLD